MLPAMLKTFWFLSLISFYVGLSQPMTQDLPAGFVIKAFAGPPDIRYPTGVAAAPTGEVFVSVDLNSSLDREPNRGKIIRCVDTDGDGQADVFTEYVSRIESPRGLCFAGDTLYVVNPPFLTAFRDRDGDGLAEDREILVEGLGFDLSFRGADHTSNGVRMGIDGWLYLAIGDYGFLEAKAKDGSRLYLHGGGVVRVRPDGTELEPYSLYTRNIYDVAVSPRLDLFARDNTNDGKGWNTRLHHFVPLANHGYPRLYKNFANEILPPLADYGGGSGTGGLFLSEPGFPEPFNDALYTCDFTTQAVYVHRLEPVEGTFRAEQEEFLSVKAIDLDVDGNSKLYVSDWRGGGYRFNGEEVGAISQISYPSLPPAEFPALKSASTLELLDYLGSASAVCRLNTQIEILQRGMVRDLEGGLKALAADRAGSLDSRVAAIFTLKQALGVEATPFLLGLYDDVVVREYVMRALSDRQSEARFVPADIFLRGLGDSHPRVQLQAIIGLARGGFVQHVEALLPFAIEPNKKPWLDGDYSDNRIIPHIALKAIVALNGYEACLSALTSDALRKAAFRCLQEMPVESSVKSLIQILRQSDDHRFVADGIEVLARLYHREARWDASQWWSTRPDDRGPYFSPETWEASEMIKRFIEETVPILPEEYHARLLIGLKQNRIDPSSFNLGLESDEVMTFVEMRNPPSLAIGPLVEAAVSSERDLALRTSAFETLGRIPGIESFRGRLSILEGWNKQWPDDVILRQAEAQFIRSPQHAGTPKILRFTLREAKGYRGQIVYQIAIHLLNSPLTSAALKRQLATTLVRGKSNPSLIRAIGEMRAVEFADWVYLAAGSENHELALAGTEAVAALKIAEVKPEGNWLGAVTVDEALEEIADQPVNLATGKMLFTRQGCSACHTVSLDGLQKGPFLGDAGTKWKRKDLVQSILTPSAVVAQGFQTQWFELSSGKLVEGFVSAEVDGIIEVRNVAGIVAAVKRDEVVKQGSKTASMMPEGLAANLTAGEFASLIGYLESLK